MAELLALWLITNGIVLVGMFAAAALGIIDMTSEYTRPAREQEQVVRGTLVWFFITFCLAYIASTLVTV